MKKLKFIYYLLAVSLLVGCGTDDEGTTTPPPDAGDIVVDFSFTSDENLFVFTNLSQGATNYRWDFGDLSFYCDKENPTYRYVKAGGDLEVTLTAMNDSGNETYITKTISTPELKEINIEIDGDFDDWQEVDFLYEEASGESMQNIKIWGGGDYINIYLEGNTTMLLEEVYMYINTDGDASTAFQSWQYPNGSGAEYVFIGSLEADPDLWGSFFLHIDPNGGWDWSELAGSKDLSLQYSGIVNVDENTNAIEMSINKDQLGNYATTIGLSISEGNTFFPKETGAFVNYDIPIVDISLCE
jgi:PKD repeat protein